MMSEVQEGCDKDKIMAAVSTVFKLWDAENCCLGYKNAGYTQQIRLVPHRISVL